MPTCPRCHSDIQPDWDWCQVCGFDPEGRKPPEPDWRDLPPPRLGENPPWGAPLGEPSGYAPGIGAPQWGTPPAGPGLGTNGNGHAHGPPPRPPRSTGTIVLFVLAAVAVVVVLIVVALVAAVALFGRQADVVGSGQTGATVPGGAARYVAPDGSFGADFPVTPALGGGAPATGMTTAGTLWTASQLGDGYFVEVAPVRAGAQIDTAAALNSGIDGFNRAYPGTYHARTPTAVAGFPAEQFSVTGSNGTIVRGTVVISPHALYVIAATGPPGDERGLDAFRDSLEVPR